MSDRNLFMIAARSAFRFVTSRGNVGVEDLFQMPLTSKSGFSLDDTAKAISRQLKTTEEESFVQPANNAGRQELQDKLDIIKLIIAEKQATALAAREAAERSAKRQKLLEALSNKRDDAINQMSEEEILKELEAL